MARVALTDRQAAILVSALGIAAADNHNLDWLNRVFKGTRHGDTPTGRAEVDEIWRYVQWSTEILIDLPADWEKRARVS